MNVFDDVIAARRSLHVNGAEIPWVKPRPGFEQRVLHARPADGVIVTESRYQPNVSFGIHRHRAPVFAMTRSGAWSHEPTRFPYVAGTYVYEPAGLIHQLFNGPQVSEAFFVLTGTVEVLDKDTREIVVEETPATVLKRYLERCEEAGLPRPNVLS